MEVASENCTESEPKKLDEESVQKEEIVPSKTKSEGSETHQSAKKSREDKGRKKDDKSVEQVLKALSTLATSEEKLAAICKKYSDIVEENRKLHLQVKQSEKRNVALQREKDQIQTEQSKAVLTRSRLENLCRELQRQNKTIKEESLLKIREEEEKRKVVSAKFQTALSEITALMQQNNENNSKLRDENLEMRNKLKTLCEQYELREQQVEKMSKQMQLESQLADVKLAKVKIDMFAEKELLTNEKEQLLVELSACQSKCQEMQKTEVALRNQITMYTEKYDEFQSALAKSNQIYSGFKSEMEKMSKKISKLEKETSVWKMKWEGSHKALLQMAAEKQQRDAELALATKQLNQLQKLCRTLQSERTSLIVQLRNEGLAAKVEGSNEDSASSVENATDSVSHESENGDAKSCLINKENTDSVISSTVNDNFPHENNTIEDAEKGIVGSTTISQPMVKSGKAVGNPVESSGRGEGDEPVRVDSSNIKQMPDEQGSEAVAEEKQVELTETNGCIMKNENVRKDKTPAKNNNETRKGKESSKKRKK